MASGSEENVATTAQAQNCDRRQHTIDSAHNLKTPAKAVLFLTFCPEGTYVIPADSPQPHVVTGKAREHGAPTAPSPEVIESARAAWEHMRGRPIMARMLRRIVIAAAQIRMAVAAITIRRSIQAV